WDRWYCWFLLQSGDISRRLSELRCENARRPKSSARYQLPMVPESREKLFRAARSISSHPRCDTFRLFRKLQTRCPQIGYPPDRELSERQPTCWRWKSSLKHWLRKEA